MKCTECERAATITVAGGNLGPFCSNRCYELAWNRKHGVENSIVAVAKRWIGGNTNGPTQITPKTKITDY